jgi:hypothetical protein
MLKFIREQASELRLLKLWVCSDKQSLRKIIKEIDQEHFKANYSAAVYKYGRCRSFINWIQNNFKKSIFLVLILYMATVALAKYLPGSFICLHPFNTDIILATQATLIGMVYPLVIALVGILFKMRSIISSRLNIFLKETEALFTGVSGLSLCGIIALQFVMENFFHFTEKEIFLINILNCFWFFINILLLCFFLIQTVRYVHPKTHWGLFYKYLVNIAWPSERQTMIAVDRQCNAIKYGYISRYFESGAGSMKKDAKEVNITITFPGFIRESNYVVKKFFPRERQAVDINFSLLNIVAEEWFRKVVFSKGVLTDKNKPYELKFPAIYRDVCKGDVILATSSASDFGWAQKFLIHRAYRFALLRHVYPPTIEEILDDQISDLISLVELGRLQEFRDKLSRIKDLYIFLFKIASAKVNGKICNYSQMYVCYDWFGRPLNICWAAKYKDLFKYVIDNLLREVAFFSSCIYIGAHIYLGSSKFIEPSGLVSVSIDLTLTLFDSFSEWALLTYKSETGISMQPGASFILGPRTVVVYERVWREFVAGWGYLANCFYFETDNKCWDGLVNKATLLSKHLYGTIRMVAVSAWRGDSLAVSWATDILVRWYNENNSNWGWASKRNLLINSDIVTIKIFGKVWGDIDPQSFARFQGGQEVTPQQIFGAAVENLWEDSQFYLLLVLVRWAGTYGIEGSIAGAAKKVLNRETFDKASSHDIQSFTLVKAIACVLRIFMEGPFENGYRSQLDPILKCLKDITQEAWVSGRIYSTTDFNDISSFIKEQAIVLVALAGDRTAHLTEELTIFLLRSVNDSGDKVAINLQQQLNKIKEAISLIDKSNKVLPFLSKGNFDLDRQKGLASTLVSECLSILATHREQRMRNALLDGKKIEAIERFASETGFTEKTAHFPIHLFKIIKPTEEDLEPQTWQLLKYERGRLTTQPMAEPIYNESEWWQKTVQGYVAVVVFSDILKQAKIREIKTEAAEEWWAVLKEESSKIKMGGDEAILVIANITNPQWLYEWAYSYPGQQNRFQRPADIHIWRVADSDSKPGYELNINDISVYSASQIGSNCCYLIPKSILEKVEFKKYKSGQFVSIEVEENIDDPWHCTLKTSFGRRVMLGCDEVTKIIFSD